MKLLRRLARHAKGADCERAPRRTDKYWKPANILDNLLFRLRDAARQPTIQRAINQLGGRGFDVIIADGGH